MLLGCLFVVNSCCVVLILLVWVLDGVLSMWMSVVLNVLCCVSVCLNVVVCDCVL